MPSRSPRQAHARFLQRRGPQHAQFLVVLRVMGWRGQGPPIPFTLRRTEPYWLPAASISVEWRVRIDGWVYQNSHNLEGVIPTARQAHARFLQRGRRAEGSAPPKASVYQAIGS